jgi:hypothetical protein
MQRGHMEPTAAKSLRNFLLTTTSHHTQVNGLHMLT